VASPYCEEPRPQAMRRGLGFCFGPADGADDAHAGDCQDRDGIERLVDQQVIESQLS
jgi:hypothetical protein